MLACTYIVPLKYIGADLIFMMMPLAVIIKPIIKDKTHINMVTQYHASNLSSW